MKLIEFGASWCHPCGRQKEIMKGFDACQLQYVDVDQDEDDLCGKYGVRSVPFMAIVDDDGNALKTFVGETAAKDLNEAVAALQRKNNEIKQL